MASAGPSVVALTSACAPMSTDRRMAGAAGVAERHGAQIVTAIAAINVPAAASAQGSQAKRAATRGATGGSPPAMRSAISKRALPMSEAASHGRVQGSAEATCGLMPVYRPAIVSSRAPTSRRSPGCSAISVPFEQATPGQHLVKHAAERPHVAAPVDGLVARLLRAHVCGRPQQTIPLDVRHGRHRRRLAGTRERVGTVVAQLGSGRSPGPSPTPSDAHLDVRGFQIAMPRRRARGVVSSASAICCAIGSASAIGNPPAGDPITPRAASDQFEAPGPSGRRASSTP